MEELAVEEVVTVWTKSSRNDVRIRYW